MHSHRKTPARIVIPLTSPYVVSVWGAKRTVLSTKITYILENYYHILLNLSMVATLKVKYFRLFLEYINDIIGKIKIKSEKPHD
jgi:hypothetical protein